MRPVFASLCWALAGALALGGCGSSRTMPSPPEGWVLVSEDSVPSPDEFETAGEVIDEFIANLQSMPGALKKASRGERWAVLDIDAARTAAAMPGRRAPEAAPTPAQLRIFVTRDLDGTFTINQTMYAPPFGAGLATVEPAPETAPGPPAPPEGWTVETSSEEPFPRGPGFETPEQILDGWIETLRRVPGAITQIRRGEGWAVIDVDAAAMAAGLAAQSPDGLPGGSPEGAPEPWPTQIHLRVRQAEDGTMMIKQTVYASPKGDG